MKTILKPEKWVIELYPEATNAEYKLSNFVVVEKYDKDIIILHTITWGIYVLSETEYDNILSNDYLRGCKLVVNSDIDEQSISDIVYGKRMVKPKLPTYEEINSYVILTTTACNARCHYCYEAGNVKTETMTIDTAEKVVNFIKTHKTEGQTINIQWFGGEPLLNTRVIDYISNRLKEEDIKYTTSIISNAYLFNTENIEKAKELWNLNRIQITIDGLFETYNEIKNYVYSDVDAFMVLMDNIKNIMDNSDIHITLRFNIGNENVFKMFDTISYLKEEFKEYEEKNKISFYAYCLFSLLDGKNEKIDGFDEELEKIKSIITLNNADKCDIFSYNSKMYNRQPMFEMCMAYNATCVAILPNGDINPCEHIRTEDIFGNITDGVTNMEVVKRWQKFDGPEINYCKEISCPLQPLCPRFYMCPNAVLCNENNNKQDIRLETSRKRLKNTYEYYIKELEKRKAGK